MNTKDIIGEEVMRAFAEEIGKIIGAESLLTIDVFSVSHYLSERTISYNYGRPVYIDEILPGFLSEKGSIGLVDREIDEGHEIEGNVPNELKRAPFKYKHIEDFKFKGTCGFDDYIDYLSQKKFGSYCLWLNDFIREENVKTNVSVLLVLDIVPNENQLSALKLLTYKKLFTKGFRITVNEFIIMYTQVADQERIFKALDADKQHFGHTIQNIFPQGLSNVNAALEEVKSDTVAYNKLSRAKKDLTMSKVIFQSIAGQEIKELNDKSVLDFLEFLREHSTSRHIIELDLERARMYRQTKISFDAVGNVLLILWNFFHNATKYSGNQELETASTVLIKAFDQDGALVILFSNSGTTFIKPQTKAFLTGDADLPDIGDQKGGKGGLEIARRRLTLLNWSIMFPPEDAIVTEKINVYGVDMERQYFQTLILLKTNIRRI